MTRLDRQQLIVQQVRRRFNQVAADYDAVAFIEREIGTRLLEHLEYVRLPAEHILDLGCGTGLMTELAVERYQAAQWLGVDFALAMVEQYQHRLQRLQQAGAGVCATAQHLPLSSAQFDLILSNLLLPWCNGSDDLSMIFKECARVLRPQGLLLFSTLGPDTLHELRSCWSVVDAYTHTHRFTDMHLIGDALVAAGFRDPVIDREVITLTYPTVQQIVRDLQATGATNATQGAKRGLMGKQAWQAFYQAYEYFKQADGRYPVTYEVIYGHAWAPLITPAEPPARYIPIYPQ